MKIENLDEGLKKKVENEQKHINTELNINLENLGYKNVGITKCNRIHWVLSEFQKSYSKKDYNPDDWFRCRPDFNSSLEEKIENRQKYITTNKNLRDFGYTYERKYPNGNVQWKFKSIYSPEEELLIKIKNKQKTILTDDDLSKYGYQIHNHSFKKKQWVLNEFKRELDRKYSKTEKGKITNAKARHKHREKGFILLFSLNNKTIEIEYHHVHPNLPYVIPVPKKIHKSIHGTNPNHYLGVTAKFYKWLEEHPEIQIIDEIR